MAASMLPPSCFMIRFATFPFSHLTPSHSSSALNLKMEVSATGASDATKATSIGSSTTIAATGSTESDPLIQYVVLRRDLIDKWPLGSVVTQGCHASVAAIFSFKDDPYTLQYCNLSNLDAMRKVSPFFVDLFFPFSLFSLFSLIYFSPFFLIICGILEFLIFLSCSLVIKFAPLKCLI